MIEFPSTTAVDRILPKDKFIEHLDLTASLKKKLTTDVEHFRIINKFADSTLNFNALPVADEEESTEEMPMALVKEVLLLQITLKKPDFDQKLIETIAKQNPHALVFLIRCEKYARLAVYYQRFYICAWQKYEDVTLELRGKSVPELWRSFVSQIALHSFEPANTNEAEATRVGTTEDVVNKQTLDNTLELRNKAEALKKEIETLETKKHREVQTRKQFAMHKKILQLKQEYEQVVAKLLGNLREGVSNP